MTFAAEETLSGLPVYRYETHYEGVKIDQTKDLTSLPGVGVTRGIKLEPYLQVWVEPLTGRMVKYEDDTVASFYDLKTGKILHPWNHFSNGFTPESVMNQVEQARKVKTMFLLVEEGVPLFLAFLALFILLFHSFRQPTVRFFFFVLFLTAMCIVGRALFAPAIVQPSRYTGPVETIRLAAERGLLASVVWVAEQNGYFRDQGLDVVIREFPSGRAAITSMFKDGNLDMATVAQTPIVLNSFLRNDFEVIAGMVSSPGDVKILARRDKNIAVATDLRGKKIGITKGSVGHYFLSLFLAGVQIYI